MIIVRNRGNNNNNKKNRKKKIKMWKKDGKELKKKNGRGERKRLN